ncbi:MAG TPA: tetratricopeptide repeat protein [Gemmatimonadales bacterium]|nr:tetratricopeptide repeat protein [Gemmatimonadales bacterium]
MSARTRHATRTAATDPRAEAGRRRDADITFYARRVAADPIGAADRSRLAAVYLQRARETGDFADYRRAEALARRSLALRVAHNDNTYVVLASALLAQHRFTEARAAARALNARDPAVPGHRALLAEIELELGNYGAARALFDSLWPARHELSVASRLARWAEITGHTDLARRLLERARADARARRDLPPEQLAWFELRCGDLALRNGRLAEAEYAFREGLNVSPGDYRLLAALARLETARGRWREAIAYGEDAIAAVPDPATFGLISDAYAELGDTTRAAEYAHAMEIAVLGQPGQWHRAWSLFLLDHDRRVPDVLAKVDEELETRRDIYGYDLRAWALHKQHRDRDAWVSMARALSQGTTDAQLLYHASVIARALGESVTARGYLERARGVNPYYQPDRAAR